MRFSSRAGVASACCNNKRSAYQTDLPSSGRHCYQCITLATFKFGLNKADLCTKQELSVVNTDLPHNGTASGRTGVESTLLAGTTFQSRAPGASQEPPRQSQLPNHGAVRVGGVLPRSSRTYQRVYGQHRQASQSICALLVSAKTA